MRREKEHAGAVLCASQIMDSDSDSESGASNFLALLIFSEEFKMSTSVSKKLVLSDNSPFALANNSASAAVAASSGGVPLAAHATNLQDRSSVSAVEVAPLHSTKKPPAGSSRETDSVQLKVEETESSDSTSMAFTIDSSVSFYYTEKKEKKYCVRTAAAALPPPKRSRSDPFLQNRFFQYNN